MLEEKGGHLFLRSVKKKGNKIDQNVGTMVTPPKLTEGTLRGAGTNHLKRGEEMRTQ